MPMLGATHINALLDIMKWSSLGSLLFHPSSVWQHRLRQRDAENKEAGSGERPTQTEDRHPVGHGEDLLN